MTILKRRKTPTVRIGDISLGSQHPIVIQSMTNTPTRDITATLKQTKELIKAGSEMVRWTINDDLAAKAAIKIIKTLRKQKIITPIIGDFHFNGDILLTKNPELASLIDKYRINPGNVGKGNEQFETIIKIAKKNKKAIRIGVNGGSIDQDILKKLIAQNAKRKNPKSIKLVIYDAMVQSAIKSAEQAIKLGLPKNKIILSVKMSDVQDVIAATTLLAKKCDFVLHLGLTEAGSDIQGITSSSAAMGILLQLGIGDTIRISLTPSKNTPRTKEVEVCRVLLQSLGFRYFEPTVTSCPGCGRTNNTYFQTLTEETKKYIKQKLPIWTKKHAGVERLKIAVMGCVVNGPGESKHADIGISLPGDAEKPSSPVYVKGKKVTTLKGKNIKAQFFSLIDKYIKENFC